MNKTIFGEEYTLRLSQHEGGPLLASLSSGCEFLSLQKGTVETEEFFMMIEEIKKAFSQNE